MRSVVLLLLLSLAACGGGGLLSSGGDPAAAAAWRLPNGKAPSRTEFAAVVAACQDRTHASGENRAVETCLVRDFGLRRMR